MKITAYAKVNLCLDILEKTPSGYHEIRTIFHEIKNFKDILEINKTKLKDEVSIAHDLKKSPDQKGKTEIKLSENLAKKALDLLKKTFNIKDFVSIKIHKNIPISSGLGGASSDAAAVLKGLSELFKLNLSEKQIKELAKLCIKIENHYKDPQDIEWAFEKNKFYIVQSRPITAL